jgi:hypothetical protein
VNAERPPSRPFPPSWDNHVGGLPWPEVSGQRDQKKYPSPPAMKLAGFFVLGQKIKPESKSSPEERQRKQD